MLNQPRKPAEMQGPHASHAMWMALWAALFWPGSYETNGFGAVQICHLLKALSTTKFPHLRPWQKQFQAVKEYQHNPTMVNLAEWDPIVGPTGWTCVHASEKGMDDSTIRLPQQDWWSLWVWIWVVPLRSSTVCSICLWKDDRKRMQRHGQSLLIILDYQQVRVEIIRVQR